MPKNELEGLRWQPAWISELGCIKGCLNYFKADISLPWLYGGTGMAFVLNVHEVLCPSGPTAWRHEPLIQGLAPNVGFSTQMIQADKSAADFAAKQKAAWAFARGCIDLGIPCFGWEFDVPEYYVIHGYDDVGYYSGAGCDEGKGPKPWQELGDTGIGVLQVSAVQTCPPAPEEKTVKDALTKALDQARNPSNWTGKDYRTGVEAFELWAQALDSGKASRGGHAYNNRCWSECRGYGVAFLKEAKQRLAGKADALFDEAIEHYEVVHTKLSEAEKLTPFEGDFEAKLTDEESAALIREAGEAEGKGLEALGKLAEGL